MGGPRTIGIGVVAVLLVATPFAWPEDALTFIQPKARVMHAGHEYPVQVRRSSIDRDDRELQVGVFCGDTKVDGFIEQMDEYTSYTMPAERPRFLWTKEVCDYHLVAAIIAVTNGKWAIRARAEIVLEAQ